MMQRLTPNQSSKIVTSLFQIKFLSHITGRVLIHTFYVITHNCDEVGPVHYLRFIIQGISDRKRGSVYTLINLNKRDAELVASGPLLKVKSVKRI